MRLRRHRGNTLTNPGLVATTLLVTVAVVAMNLHALASHQRRTDELEAQQAAHAQQQQDGYDVLIAADRAFAAARSDRQAAAATDAAAGADPPEVA